MNRLIFCYAIYCLFFASSCLVQAQNLWFESYSINEGLSQSCVSSIIGDSHGYVWAGTNEGGLNKFNGYDFSIFTRIDEDTTSLAGNHVDHIFEDSRNRIWVSTDLGVCYYNRELNNFFRLKLIANNRERTRFVFCVYEDREHNIWIGSVDGIYLFDAESNSCIRSNENISGISYKIQCISELDSERLILGGCTTKLPFHATFL